jgi:hypothetical protein
MSDASAAPSNLDAFELMRATNALAPLDRNLNVTRWLIGESLRRYGYRAGMKVSAPWRFATSGDIDSKIVDHAREKMCAAEAKVGPAAWPILTRVLIDGKGVRECRDLVPESTSNWIIDAVVMDRLRNALDAIGPILGFT